MTSQPDRDAVDFSSVVSGFYLVPILTLFGELGVLDRLAAGEEVDVDELCRSEGLDRHLVIACAEYLAQKKLLEAPADSLVATDAGRSILPRWTIAMIHYAYSPLMLNLFELARGEKSYGYGRDVYRNMYFDARGSGLSGVRSGRFRSVAEYIGNQGFRCLLDLGCGDGRFLLTACETSPDVEVVGLDQSEIALDAARDTFARAGLSERATFRQGDLRYPDGFMRDEAIRKADVATIWFILHEITWEGTEAVKDLLQRFRKSFPDMLLAVNELYRLPSEQAALYADRAIPEALLFHDLSLQRTLTRDEWIEVYESCGYRVADAIAHTAIPPAGPAIETLVLKPE